MELVVMKMPNVTRSERQSLAPDLVVPNELTHEPEVVSKRKRLKRAGRSLGWSPGVIRACSNVARRLSPRLGSADNVMADFLKPHQTSGAMLMLAHPELSSPVPKEDLSQPAPGVSVSRALRTCCRPCKPTNMYRWLLRLKRTTGGSVFLLLISIYFVGFSLLEIPGIAITLWQAGRGFVRTRGVPQAPGCPGPACQQDLLTLLKGAVQGNHSQQQQLQDQFGISLQTLIDNAKPRADLNKTQQAVGNDSAVEKGLLQSDNRTTENTTAVEEEFFYYVRSKDGSSRQISGKHPVVKIHQDVNLTAIMEAFHHPWNRDDTSLSLTRSELEQCCSSRKMALMTQENYAVGQRVPSAFNLTQFYTLTEKIHNLLRKKSPFPEKLYKTCSVVGNSGVLRESNCADHIDGADYVFRCNMPPLNDKRHLSHVGTKSNFTTVPMSMLRKYGKIEKSQELKDRWYNQTLQYEGMVIIKKPKDSTAVMQAELEKRRTDLRVAYEDPAHFIAVQKYWAQRGLPRKITSGFYVITVALMLCEQVNVYGFWPFPFDDSGGKVRYHYYYAPIFVAPETHDMAVEFMKVRELHQKGVIKMQLGKCQDKKPVRKHRKL